MTYIEMCYKIKELLFNIDSALNSYTYLAVYYNGTLMSGELRGDIESISEEINGYLGEVMNDANREIAILKKLDDYISRVVIDYTEVFLKIVKSFIYLKIL